MTELFTQIGEGGAAFAEALGNILESVTTIFWTPGAEGALGSPTFIGVLTLAGVVGGLAMFGINWIGNLFKKTTKR